MPGNDLDVLFDNVAAKQGDCTETEPLKCQIGSFPKRYQEHPKVVDLASLSPNQVCELIGVTKAQAKALLLIERDALPYDDVFVIDRVTGLRMTSTTWEAFQSPGV